MPEKDFCLICACFCAFCVLVFWLIARGLKASIERHVALLEKGAEDGR